MSSLSIAILTTNYNTWDLARRCVEHCYQYDNGNFDRLVVYDDCSRTQPGEPFPVGTHIHLGSSNVGLTNALNIAFSLLSEDIVVLFDSDAYPVSPFCSEVLQRFEHDPQLGLLAFQTIGKSGLPTESYTTEPNFWSLLLGQAMYAKLEKWLSDQSGNISVFTCAMAVRRQAFVELNGFDEAFDWLDLDHDFSMRMNRSNWKVSVADSARIFHEGGGTPQLTRKRVLRFYKTRWYLLNKFNRLPTKQFAKRLIISRLYVEYIFLALFGRTIISDPDRFSDKLQGRRELIAFCKTNY